MPVETGMKVSFLIRKPDDFVSSLTENNIVALLGEEENNVENNSTGKVMMFSCLSCGAGLKVDGKSRTVDCSYCNTENFLPEELWRRFNPVPKAGVVFMLMEY